MCPCGLGPVPQAHRIRPTPASNDLQGDPPPMTETSTLVTTTTRSSQRPQPAPDGPRRPTERRWPKRRADESGLTTLEWLLIVAAVAGLAALAVVLVQNVVSQTSEQIAGSSARRVAAELHAADINDEARAIATAVALTGAAAIATAKTAHAADLSSIYRKKCQRLRITYGDVPDLSVDWGVLDAAGPRIHREDRRSHDGRMGRRRRMVRLARSRDTGDNPVVDLVRPSDDLQRLSLASPAPSPPQFP